MPHGPAALPTFILFMALYVSMIVGGEVSMRGSGVDALASGEVVKTGLIKR